MKCPLDSGRAKYLETRKLEESGKLGGGGGGALADT